MNFKAHLNILKKTLKADHALWAFEILQHYPRGLKAYPPHWISYLKALGPLQLWQLNNRQNLASLPGHPLKERLQNLAAATKLESFKAPDHLPPLPHRAYFKMSRKKKHEINCIAGLYKQKDLAQSCQKLLDIGSGVGHLGRFFSRYQYLPAVCIERDGKLIEQAQKRFSKQKPPPEAQNLSFDHQEFGENTLALQKIFGPRALSIGLHTCGPLAYKHLKAHIENNGNALLNFGCCYHQLADEKDQNISSYAKSAPLIFDKYALTLATRSHGPKTFDEFLIKERVKSYRYTLHLFLREREHQQEFKGLGNTPKKYYRDSNFANYAQYNLGGHSPYSQGELNDFFEKSKELVREMFLANIIRWSFGPLIEQYILTDRGLFLQEHGQEVEMKTLFKEALSPRNIGIFSTSSHFKKDLSAQSVKRPQNQSSQIFDKVERPVIWPNPNSHPSSSKTSLI